MRAFQCVNQKKKLSDGRGIRKGGDAPVRRETVLGVDPGIANTGLAIVVRTGSGYKLKALRCIESKADEPEPQRLLKIYDTVDALLTKHNIDLAAIERVYHNKNVSSSIKTGKAIGAILCVIGAHAKTAIEVTPQQVKRASGLTLQKADKASMIRAMARLLLLQFVNNIV